MNYEILLTLTGRNPLKAGQVIPTPYCQRASVSMLITLFPSPLCRRSDLPQAWRERVRVRGLFFFSPSPLSSPIKGEENNKEKFSNLIFLYHKTSTLSNPLSFNQSLFPQNPPIFLIKTHLR
jgi:hypothetical protein